MKSTIVIRFTRASGGGEIRDLEIPLLINFDKDDVNRLVSTPWLKLIIRNRVPECDKRRLRLIYNGKVLNKNTNYKHDIFEPKWRQLAALDEESRDDDLRVYIHCLIGEELTQDELREEGQLDDRPQEVTTTPQVIGFDRLLQQGFSQEDVDDLRRQFHSIYMPSLFELRRTEINDLEEDERRHELIRQLEERWIESTINATPDAPPSREDRPTVDTSAEQPADRPRPANDLDEVTWNEDLLVGLVLGVFLGVIALVLVMMDSTVLNKRQKMALTGGIFVNFLLAITRGTWI